MDKTKIALGVFVTSTVLLGLFLLKVPAVITNTVTDTVNTVREQLGAAGSTFTSRQDFLAGLSSSANLDVDDTLGRASSTAGLASTTLTAAQICQNGIINVSLDLMPGVATLPSANAIIASDCFKQGASKHFLVRNGTTTSATPNTTAVGNVGFNSGASTTIITNVSSTAAGAPNVFTTATTTIPYGGYASIDVYLITSSTPWVIYDIVQKRSY